ncbi:hypothetical protein HZC53_04485 [Candidatus Uhrbacteria bacterium]|nr:hypothetical protein [Candidatus Uhrbacteria bacterium]
MNKTIRDALLAQIRHAEYGVPEALTTSFKNIEVIDDGGEHKLPPPPNMLLVMKNQPAYTRHGQPVTIKSDELVRLQAARELDETTAADRAGMPPSEREHLEWLESQSVLEYQADLQILYGNMDHLTPTEALAHPGLKRIGNEIEEWINAGVMDVIDTTPDESGVVKDPRGRRPNVQRINLDWVRRALTKNSPCDRAPGHVGYFDDKFDDKGNEIFARRFIRFTGTANMTLQGGGGVYVTHLIFGRTPEPRAKKFHPNKRPRGRVGQNGRGFLFIMRLQEPLHAITTWMDMLLPELPGSDNPIATLMNEYVEGLPELLPGLDDAQLDALVKSLDALAGRMEKEVRVSKFVGWLEDHPTNTSIIRNMKLLVEEQAVQPVEQVPETKPEVAAAETATAAEPDDADFMAALAAMNAAAPSEAKPAATEAVAPEVPKVEPKPEAAAKPAEETAPAESKPAKKRAPRAKKAKVEAAPEAAPAEATPADPAPPAPTPPAPEAAPQA